MGNTQSPSTNPQFDLATRAFTQKELEDLNLLFVSLAAQSQSSGRYVSPSAFEAYYGLHGLLGQRVFDLVTQNRKDQRLTFEDIVIAKGTYEKGTKDEIEEYIYQILDVTSDGIMARSDLEAVLTTMLDDIFSSEHGSSSHQEVLDIFINAATFSKHHNECAEKCMSFEDFRSWCALLPSVRKFLGSLLMPSDMRRPGSQVPRLLHIENSDSNMVILRKEYAWLIAGSLSLQEQEEWKLIYHSALNGLSFTTFLGNISLLSFVESLHSPCVLLFFCLIFRDSTEKLHLLLRRTSLFCLCFFVVLLSSLAIINLSALPWPWIEGPVQNYITIVFFMVVETPTAETASAFNS